MPDDFGLLDKDCWHWQIRRVTKQTAWLAAQKKPNWMQQQLNEMRLKLMAQYHDSRLRRDVGC